MCGERVTVHNLTILVQHNVNSLRTELAAAAVQGDRARGIKLQMLIATAEGRYDFTLNFSPIEQLLGPRPDAGGGAGALDPTGGLSLQDAVRRQLGIRLEDTKLPAPVLVIDSINETPTDN